MKLLFTKQAIESLQKSIYFLEYKATEKQIQKIITKLFSRCDELIENPEIGQIEEYLEHLGMAHRRIIVGNYKYYLQNSGKNHLCNRHI